jgi:hypothetical protein
MFWCSIHTIFCIVDFACDNIKQKELQDEFKRMHIDKKLVLYYIIEGSLFDPEVYYKAVKEVCFVATRLQTYNEFMQPIAIFKGHVRFIDQNITKTVRVATALTIYDSFWDVLNLACEDAVFSKELLKGDIFRGESNGDHALLLSPKTVHKLAIKHTDQKDCTTFQEFMNTECKYQMLLAHPLCFHSDYLNLHKLLVQSDLSLTVWYAFGRFCPHFLKKYIYNHVKLSNNIN